MFQAGIPIDNYYASEVDKYAIHVSGNNHPDIIRLGNVCELDTSTLSHIDIFIDGNNYHRISNLGWIT